MRTGFDPEVQRLERTRQKFAEDTAGMLEAAWGRYTPDSGYSKLSTCPEKLRLDISVHGRNEEAFLERLHSVLLEHFYQPTTCDKYVACVSRFLDWLRVPCIRVEKDYVVWFVSHLRGKGLSNASISLHISALRTTFDRLCGLRLTTDLALPRPVEMRNAPLSQKEVDRLFSAADDWREQLAIVCLGGKLMTIREMLGIRLQDIDWERKAIRVWPGFGRGEREIAFPKHFLGLLRLGCSGIASGDYLFCGRQGSRASMTLRALSGKLRSAGMRAGMTININVLRKSPGPSRAGCEDLAAGVAVLPVVDQSSPDAGRPHRSSHTAGAVLLQPGSSRSDSVGNLSLTVGIPKFRRHFATTPVTVTVSGNVPVPIELYGTTVEEGWRGNFSVKLPRLELWQDEMKWLTPEMRERLAEPATQRSLSDRIRAVYGQRKEQYASPSTRWPWSARRKKRRHRFN